MIWGDTTIKWALLLIASSSLMVSNTHKVSSLTVCKTSVTLILCPTLGVTHNWSQSTLPSPSSNQGSSKEKTLMWVTASVSKSEGQLSKKPKWFLLLRWTKWKTYPMIGFIMIWFAIALSQIRRLESKSLYCLTLERDELSFKSRLDKKLINLSQNRKSIQIMKDTCLMLRTINRVYN